MYYILIFININANNKNIFSATITSVNNITSIYSPNRWI